MAHEEADARLEPAPAPGLPASAGAAGPDGAGVLGTVEPVTAEPVTAEPVTAEVAAVTQLRATQPEVAGPPADAATAADDELRQSLVELATSIERALTERDAPLRDALEQLRLSLLAGLDRTIDRFDRPTWLPQLQAALSEDHRLDELVETVNALCDGVRASAAIADALEGVGECLAAFEVTADQVARNVLALEERVAPLPDRVAAIAAQVDRLTPLARAGDEAGSLLAQLHLVSEGLAELTGHIDASAAAVAGPTPGRGTPDEQGDDRIDALIEALAAVTRRQDEVTASITAVLDQVRRPVGMDTVLDRIEQREESLAARLDGIASELRRQGDHPPASPADAGPTADESATALRAALERLDQQEQAVAAQLELVGQRLAEVADRQPPANARREADPVAAAPPAGPEPPEPVVEVLADLARRQDDLAAALDRRLSAIETRLEAAARESRSAPGPSASARAAARRLAELRAERARVQAQLRDERLLAAGSWPDEDLGEEV